LAVAATLVAMRGVFSSSRIFFVRDLSAYFWPHHLWLRATVGAGHLPLWNPGPGLGYPALSDPALQLFFLPTLPIRLLLPDVIGFNIWIALPFPLAALGFFRFAKRHVSPPAAALGAIAYGVSGPVLSLASCGNPAWTAALAPWVLVAIDALAGSISASLLAWLSVLFACGIVGGEPVTLAGAAALAVGYAAFGTPIAAPGWRPRLRLAGATLAGASLGLLLASIQVFPLIDTTRRSIRGAGLLADQWSLHPLLLGELVVSRLFGDPLGTPVDFGPWLVPLNGGREPYLASLYVGAGVVLLAWVAAAAGRPRHLVKFWLVALVSSLVLALGSHTPAYQALRASVPLLRTFRYPVKYAVLAALALAALAALGFDALRDLADQPRLRSRALGAGFVLGLGAACVTLLALVFPAILNGAVSALATAVGLGDPGGAASFLVARLQGAAPPLLAIALGGTACLAVASSRRPEAGRARAVLLAMTALDPLIANAMLNPTLDASSFREPEWLARTREHPGDRVFIAQDLVPAPGRADEDNPPPLAQRRDLPLVRMAALYEAKLRRYPAAWGVREALSVEVTGLWPVEYLDLLLQYENAGREDRTRFLQRAGTRYYLLPHAPAPGASALVRLAHMEPLALYEGPEPGPRAWVVKGARREPDVTRQTALLFDAAFDPSAQVLLVRDAPPSGRTGAPQEPSAAITVDEPARVCVRCGVPAGGGYLVVSDAYEPNWRVRVDGEDAPLLRADGIFRGVALVAGTHDACFTYESRPLRWGTLVSALTALGLLAAAFQSGRSASARAAGVRSSGRPPAP
jgi:hypothetical protein